MPVGTNVHASEDRIIRVYSSRFAEDVKFDDLAIHLRCVVAILMVKKITLKSPAKAAR